LGKHLAPPRPRKKRGIPFVGIVLFAAGFLACFAVGFVVARMARDHSTPAQAVVSYFVPSPQAVFGKDRIFVLLMGIDYDYDDKDQEYSTNSRTDTIMVGALDFPTKSLDVLSVPRDMDVVYPNGHEGKINEAYSLGGPRESEDIIGKFLGLPVATNGHPFDRYVTLRINATKELIDAIGGIDVPVAEQMDYDDNWGHLHIHFKPGLHHMNGDQAVSYSRFRHDACSDPCRIQRQQQVLRITMDKLKNDKFNDLVHINDLIAVVKRNVYTNFTDDEIRSLAFAYSGINLSSVKMAQVPFTGDKIVNGGDDLVADDAGKAALVQKLLLGPMGPPPVVPPADLAAIKPSSVRIEVQNGTGITGMGAKMAAQLRKEGFVVADVTDADNFNYQTTEIHTHSKQLGVGQKVQAALHASGATITPDPVQSGAATTDVTVIVGKDYAVPPSPAPQASAHST
jgi:LCP family protein required for cell wall assembly